MKIAASILTADFSKMQNEIAEINCADYLHLDIMDGNFVPNISFGPAVVKSLRPHTPLPFDAHLMVMRPEMFLEDFFQAGCDIITVHAEACLHLHRTLEKIKELGIKAGVSINPHTSVEYIKNVLDICDLVLVMSVNPGFGGQKFIDSSLNKIKDLAMLREKHNFGFLIEVDGGINAKTAQLCKECQADILVAGSYVFNSPDKEAAIKKLRG